MEKTKKVTVQKLRVLVQINNKVFQVDLTENQGLMILDLIRQMTNNHMMITNEIEEIKLL